MKRTKIICTLGPASDDYTTIVKMIKAGMNVARLNMSHGTLETHQLLIDTIKKARADLKVPCAILVDTRGPEVRIGTFKNKKIMLQKGKKFIFTSRQIVGNENEVSVKHAPIIKIAKTYKCKKLFANNGLIEFKILEVTDTDIVCRVIHGGILSDNKSFALPHVPLDMPYMSEVDKEHLRFAVENQAEFIACSFVNDASDVQQVREYINSLSGNQEIISKIESLKGIQNLEKIIKVSDAIMIARGDMATEVPIEQIPSVQKKMINQTIMQGKPVIVATEMLESMIENIRPTRAEATDVAGAIYDSTSATMLSGESASGKHPIEAISTMAKIATASEKHINYNKSFLTKYNQTGEVLDAVSYSACSTARALNAKVIVCFTKSGKTAKWISRFRPDATILAVTLDEKTYHTLSLSWGVTPIINKEYKTFDEIFMRAEQLVKEHNLAKKGDTIIITSGVPVINMGPTNMIKISTVE